MSWAPFLQAALGLVPRVYRMSKSAEVPSSSMPARVQMRHEKWAAGAEIAAGSGDCVAGRGKRKKGREMKKKQISGGSHRVSMVRYGVWGVGCGKLGVGFRIGLRGSPISMLSPAYTGPTPAGVPERKHTPVGRMETRARACSRNSSGQEARVVMRLVEQSAVILVPLRLACLRI